MPILFYVPECREASQIKKMINQFGGICIYIVECCCFQIYPERTDEDRDEDAIRQSFSKGPVFSSNWLVESIASQKLLPPADFTKFHLRENFKATSFSRTKFSIREIIKIFDVVSKNPSRRTKNPTYWGTILDKGIFPGRSVHSINA